MYHVPNVEFPKGDGMVEMNFHAQANIIFLQSIAPKLCSNWCFALFPYWDSGGFVIIAANVTNPFSRAQQEYLSSTTVCENRNWKLEFS